MPDAIRTSTLPNGLLLVSEQLAHVRSIAVGLSFRLGGRDDPADLAGLAHLNEHMVFKGTDRLSARAISYEAEALGAELNAFTDKELTCFYGRCPADGQAPVTGLLAEIVAGPVFGADELAREKEVIAEEIKTGEEDPESKAPNLLLEAYYGTHPMAWSVAGTVESVAAAAPDRLRRLYAERYHTGTGVAVATGHVDHDAVAAALEDKLGGWRPSGRLERPAPPPVAPACRVQERAELSQAYVCLGLPAFRYGDPRRYALSVLNAAWGGGLSSRLFQRLREDEGLVYSVSSFAELYEDSGLVGVFFIADRRKLARCVSVLREETDRLRRDRLAPAEFERARNITRSSLVLGLERPTNRMLRLARNYHLFGRVVPVDETIDRLDRVRPGDVNDLVDEVLADRRFCAGAVGPLTAADLDCLLA